MTAAKHCRSSRAVSLTRADLRATVRKLFQPDWHWLGEQCPSGSNCAYYQGFGYGNQNYNGKGIHCWVRVFRRVRFDDLTIQSFGPAQEGL